MKKTTETKLFISKPELLAAFGIREEDARLTTEVSQVAAESKPQEIEIAALTISVTKTEEVRRKALPGVE